MRAPRRVTFVAVEGALLILVGLAVRTPALEAEPEPAVCIDSGHNLDQPGAAVTVKIGRGRNAERFELREADINLDVTHEVRRILQDRDVSVIMTWDGDPTLPGPDAGSSDDRLGVTVRGKQCQDGGAGIVVSIHTNGADLPFNGTMTLYNDAADRVLAEFVHRPIYDALRFAPNGKCISGFRNFGLNQGEWWLSLGADQLAVVLLEPVDRTNDAEARLLFKSIAEAPGGRRAQIARTEAAAVLDFLGH